MNLSRISKLLARGCSILMAWAALSAGSPAPAPKPVLTVAHITDVHVRPEHDAPARFRASLRQLRAAHPGIAFVLNTGDTIDGADGRERTVEKWRIWKTTTESELKGIPIFSVLGNHDMLEGPDTDPLVGKAGACRSLGMPNRFYSFDRAGWHFILLDGNGIGTDKEQMVWLENELTATDPGTPIAILSHQPILSVGAVVHCPGDVLENRLQMVALFTHHPNVKLCLAGHTHLHDKAFYNGVTYVGGGALSGAWWEREKSSDGRSGYLGTRPGYGILQLFADGSSSYEYCTHD